LVVWFVDAISLLITAAIVPGITIESAEGFSPIVVATMAALLIGIINLFLRPLMLLLALPLGFIVIFIVGFLANAIVLLIASRILPGLEVNGLIPAIVGGIVLAAINAVISSIIFANDDDSFYQGVVERLARRQRPSGPIDQTQGLVVLEVDGLSYWHIQKALEQGYMPTLKKMMDEHGYQLSRIDCGLPSQTSACQAGIMFGDNFDIPSFRWYDKEKSKLYVSGKDAAELNTRFSKGQGLMRGGSSINNMLNGDAEKSVLTFANLRTGTPEDLKRRSQDIYLLMLNPYFLTRVIALFVGDVILELVQGWNQKRRNVQPRLNRLHKFYPFVRGSTTVFMRDIAASLVILDIIRGAPSIYTTYCGYDEVAHHSGPWTSDAFGTLRQFDHVVARVLEAIEKKAPRPYELLLLSDHGQSFGATFHQRYGVELKEYIESLLPQGTRVAQSSGGDDGAMSVTSMAAELSNMQQQNVGGRVGQSVVKNTQRTLQRAADERETGEDTEGAKVIVCGSGNIAQVYFDIAPRKLALQELNAEYPGMLDSLVKHEGVGFIVAYDEDGEPIAFGKQGARNLHTGEVTGDDPLKPYGDVELRAKQVRRVADFPHSGDLIVNSTLYPDGTVAAMEELIGNHGGLGGEQTDAFIFHPPEMHIPEVTNSADVFAILNSRRGLTKPRLLEPAVKEKEVDSWQPSTLAAGVANIAKWSGLAVRSVAFDRSAYREAADDPFMTGPALLLAAISAVIAALLGTQGLSLTTLIGVLVGFVVAVFAVFIAARGLGGKANFTQTFRAMSFARTIYVLAIFALIPALAPLARFVVFAGSFIAMWMAAVEAHRIQGLRTILLPILAIVVLVVVHLALQVLAAGAALTLDTLFQHLGMSR
jgi:uncharacterized membrane protein YvlD (DUF360 family)